MKTASSLLLIVLVCTALMPCAPVLFLAGQDSGLSLGNLDVCHSGVPAVAAGGEMPCVNVCADVQAPLYLPVFTEAQQALLTHFLLSTQNERPPKA